MLPQIPCFLLSVSLSFPCHTGTAVITKTHRVVTDLCHKANSLSEPYMSSSHPSYNVHTAPTGNEGRNMWSSWCCIIKTTQEDVNRALEGHMMICIGGIAYCEHSRFHLVVYGTSAAEPDRRKVLVYLPRAVYFTTYLTAHPPGCAGLPGPIDVGRRPLRVSSRKTWSKMNVLSSPYLPWTAAPRPCAYPAGCS